MKQIIRKRLCIVILTAMLTTLLINYCIEIHNAQNEMYTSAREMFWQVGQILDQNEKEAEKERENLKEQCFIRAKAIAYILQDRPQVTGDQQEMEKAIYTLDPSPNILALTLTPGSKCSFSCQC